MESFTVVETNLNGKIFLLLFVSQFTNSKIIRNGLQLVHLLARHDVFLYLYLSFLPRVLFQIFTPLDGKLTGIFFPTIDLGYGHLKIQKFAERKDFSRKKLIPLTNFYFDSFDQGLVESSAYIEETSMKAQHLLTVHQIPGSRKTSWICYQSLFISVFTNMFL